MKVPIYLITGFLDSGKTTLIKETLEGHDFSKDKDSTLIIQFEEGEVEFEDDWLEKYNASLIQLDSSIDLTLELMKQLHEIYNPKQIFIEFNGMQTVSELLTREMFDKWIIIQILTTIDASTFLTYVNNMKPYMFEITRYSSAIIFNRVDDSISKTQLRNNIKVVNREAQIIYMNKNGQAEEYTMEDLPFDTNLDVINISDDDYGIWYMDAIENMNKYDEKDIIIRGIFLERIPNLNHSFVLGRLAMVCCADDMVPISIPITGVNVDQMILNNWYEVLGTLRKTELSNGSYTLVIYAKNVKTYPKPKYELVNFN